MKHLKVLILLLVVTAMAGGFVYYFTRDKADGTITPPKSTIKQETVEKNIKEQIENAPNSTFCVAAYEDILKQINLFFSDEPTNKKTYTMMLQGAYTRKFVEQANYVFDRATWGSSDISTIRKELKRCKVFSPDDSGLRSISNILNDYDKLVKYNEEVNTACRQHPKCLSNINALYMDDDWNIGTTKGLISSVPDITTKAKNSPIYQQTRKTKVEEQLKRAHKKFIEDKMACAEKEAVGYNYNAARKEDYDKMGAKLYKNFETYVSKWGEAETVNKGWLTKVKDWEKYTIPQQTPNTTSTINF